MKAYCRSCNRAFEVVSEFDESYLENVKILDDGKPAVKQKLHPKVDCDLE